MSYKVKKTHPREFFSCMLDVLTGVRQLHWRSNSYAQHQALGEFYDSLSDKLDDLVETYQGYHGIEHIPAMGADAKDAAEWVKMCVGKCHAYRELFKEPALQNIIDEIAALSAKTLYKLENLT